MTWVTKAIRVIRNAFAGVRAKVLSIDAEKQRLSLGLKPSYFGDGEEHPDEAEEEEGTPDDADDDMDAEVLEAMGESSDEEEDWRAGAEILTGDNFHHSFCTLIQHVICQYRAKPLLNSEYGSVAALGCCSAEALASGRC